MGRLGPSGNPLTWEQATGEAAFTSGGAAHKNTRVRETRHWWYLMADDMRWDDIHYLTNYVIHMLALGENWMEHRGTSLPCWPCRAEAQTGLWGANHGMNANNSSDSIANYASVYTSGVKTTTYTMGRATAQWMGPWSSDLALRAGYARKRVSHAQQIADNITVGGRNVASDHDDDFQAFSGNLYAQLSAEGVHVGFFGKLSNGYTPSTDKFPSGVERIEVEIETGGESADQWNFDLKRLGAVTVNPSDNPYNGAGLNMNSSPATGGSVAYDVGAVTASCTWSGGKATITRSSHGLAVGDEVTITSASPSGYNGTYTVTDVPNVSSFKYVVADPGGSSATGHVYNRSKYAGFYYVNQAFDYLDTLDDSEPFFINLTCRLPHAGDGGEVGSGYVACAEKLYDGTTSAADFKSGGAFDAEYAPQRAVGFINTSDRETVQTHRTDMMRSLDDMIGMIATYSNARWGTDGWGIVLCSDQGIQNGEQNARGNGASKQAIWDGSARSVLTWRHTQFFDQNVEVTGQPSMHADIPITFLDLFGLSDHHWLTCDPTDPTKSGTKDGRSLLRVTDSSDVAHNRVIPIQGDFKGGTGSGFSPNTSGRWKYIELARTKSAGRRYYPYNDPNQGGSPIDYELTEYAVGSVFNSTQHTTYHAIVDALFDNGRFDPATDTNVTHTTASP